MKGKSLLLITFSLLLVLALGGGIGGLWAKEPEAPGGGPLTADPVTTAFTYQGRLMEGGSPADGEYDFWFKLFDSTGSEVGSPGIKIENENVSNGLFTVELDFGEVFDGTALWLEIGVRPGASSEDDPYTTLTPRQPLTATPYALYARSIPLAGSGSATTAARSDHNHWGASWSGTGTGLSLNSSDYYGLSATGSSRGVSALGTGTGGVGVYGQTNSTTGRGVDGWAATAGGTTYGVYGGAASASGYGVYGTAPMTGTVGIATSTTPPAYGVYGQSASSLGGAGVYGLATGTGGTTGVMGESTSSLGTGVSGEAPFFGVKGFASATSGTNYGVYGESDSASGYGVYGTAPVTGTAGIASYTGIYGEADDVYGRGVFGWATDTSGAGNPIGVWGQADDTSGVGVFGWATKDSGTNYGLYGRTDSDSGRAVYGYATADTGTTYGVYGKSDSSYGRGVYGYASASTGTINYGVYGESASPGGGRGVYGKAPSIGVYGYATAGTGATSGVYGESASTGGRGVSGYASAGSGTTYGVYGTSNSPNGYGVYAVSQGVGLYARGVSGYLIEAYGSVYDDREFYVDNDGDVYADGTFHTPASDFAELLPAVEGLEPGDVLVIGPDGNLSRSTEAYQPIVVGVYSTNPGFVGGAGDDADLAGKVPLAIAGLVPVKASAENGPIRPGDLLVASSTPGHAMRAGDEPPIGTVIGKALESFDSSTGIIQMLVMLQ